MNGLLKAQEDNLLQYILDEIHQMIKRLPRFAVAALGVTGNWQNAVRTCGRRQVFPHLARILI
jgi:hypothetical protein